MDSAHRRSVLAFALAFAILAGCSPAAPPAGSTGSNSPNPSTGTVMPSVSAAPPSPSQEESGLTGTWDGTWEIDPPYETVVGGFTMELVQTGDSFSGPVEITNTDCSNGTVEGTLDGSTLTFGWVITPQPVQFTGSLDGSSMSGTWSANACSDASIALTGTWEATKRPD
jgi:hypothetical protein